MYRLTSSKIDCPAIECDGLVDFRNQVHLDAMPFTIDTCVMAKRGEIEVGVEFRVDSVKQIPIERGRHAGGIVVGRVKHMGRLPQVDTNEQSAARTDKLPDSRQQSGGTRR